MRLGRARGGILGSVAVVATVACVTPSLSVASAPPNDDFSDRQQLGSALPIALSTTNSEATVEVGEPSHSGFVPAGHSIWFEWEAPDTEHITIGTCGSEPDTILTVYTGSAFDALTEVSSNRYSFGPTSGCIGGSEVTFRATADTKYQLQVDGNGYHASGEPSPDGEGAIELQVESQGQPANDDFADATPIPGTGTAFTLDSGNWGATKEAGEPDHRGRSGGSSIWFKWTAPRTNGAFIQACGGQIPNQTVVAVYTGPSVDALSPVVGFSGEPDCRYSFMANAGVTYWIAIDGKPSTLTGAGAMADPGFHLSIFPANDDFEASGDLQGSKSLIIGYANIGATKQVGEPNHAGNAGGASIWFAWKAPITGSVRFSVCQASFRPLLAVYTGASLQSLQSIAQSDNPVSPGCLPANRQGGVALNIDAGTVYRLAVDGFNGATGGFNLEIDTSTERLPLPGLSLAGAIAPNTRIARRKVRPRRGFARFVLASSESGASFRCKLDARRLRSCGPIVRYRNLKPGWHVFEASAVSPAGLVDSSPTVFRFKIPRRL
ncbi:MAG: hypothetical protein WA687_08035 [Solirubrobacterales bacterium]